MTNANLLKEFPVKRLKPVDGMAVTADVWEEAHAYHRHQRRFHDLLLHGAGVVTGLQVIASDPPDTAVYIQPGTAIDSHGQTIVLSEPLAYDIGSTAEGLLYLVLTYGESRPQVSNGRLPEGAPVYVQVEFGIQASTSLPDTPYVELARILREGRGEPLRDASDPAHPGPNEIDLRHRHEIGAVTARITSIAVVPLGLSVDTRHLRGVSHLARALSQGGARRVVLDDGVPLSAGLERYTLVHLVGHSAFQLDAEQTAALQAFVQGGGTLFIESCRHATTASTPASDASFAEFLVGLGIKPEALRPGHRLLEEPALFAAPPPGFESQGGVGVAEGVIFSTLDYGCLWQGERRGGAATREQIRTAMEWGGNIVAYAEARRRARAA